MGRIVFEDTEAAKSQLVIQIGKKWWTQRPEIKGMAFKSALNSNESNLRREAEFLLESDRKKYVAYKQKAEKSDYSWITSVITTGTFSDRLSANTLLIQDSPVHNLFSLHKLIDLVDSKGIRESLMSMDNLKDLFLGDLLLKDKKLKKFSELIGHLSTKEGPERNKQLIMFHFEDRLLSEYKRFLEIVAKLSMEANEAVKTKAIGVMFDLLVGRPEQEKFLLEKLVNKLGDQGAKRAAHVALLLSKLVNEKHPKMKETVVKEVEILLFRSHISPSAQFYGLCFMSRVLLEARDKNLATRMVNIYFNFFDSATKKGEIKNRLMNILITGVSRALPYAEMDPKAFEKRLDTFYKVVHLVGQNASVQGMVLLFNLIDSKESGLISDRLYTLLYGSLNDINMETCSKRALYLNLLFKAMKRDPVPHRVQAFMKRLLQIALHQPPSIVCAIMVILSSLARLKPELQSTFKPEKISKILDVDDQDEYYEDVEVDEDGVVAKIDQKPLKSQDLGKKKPKKKLRKGDKETEKSSIEVTEKKLPENGVPDQPPTWVHNKNLKSNVDSIDVYDPAARNPFYAGAKYCANWELALLKDHFHPSANLFVGKVISGDPIEYEGDPLQDFTFKRFMDRFVFRNPKKISKQTASQAAKSTLFARLNTNKSIPIQDLPNANRANVPLEEQFIYDYLAQKRKETQEKGQDDETGSVSSEDFERLLLKFEPGIDSGEADFMNVKRKKDKKDKRKGRKIGDDDDDGGSGDSDASDNDMFSDDEDFDIDSDDDYYREAFDDVDDDLAEARYDEDDGDEEEAEVDEDDDEEDMETSKYKRRGRDKNLVNLFAAADKFAHLLEGRESDDEKKHGLSDDENDEGEDEGGRRRGKRKRQPKRKVNQKGKTHRFKRRR